MDRPPTGDAAPKSCRGNGPWAGALTTPGRSPGAGGANESEPLAQGGGRKLAVPDHDGRDQQRHDRHGRSRLDERPVPLRRIGVGRGEQPAGDQPAHVILPGDAGHQEAERQVDDDQDDDRPAVDLQPLRDHEPGAEQAEDGARGTQGRLVRGDRKSTRLNSSHMSISYAVFCLKKKKTYQTASQNTNKTMIKTNNIQKIQNY